MSAGNQSGSFFEFFNQLLSNLLGRKVSSAQFVISLFTAFSRCFMKMSSTDLSTDSCGIPLVKWMMYWIVFAFFTTAETLTDIVLSWAERCPVYGVFMAMDERLNDTRRRFPFYFELKIAFVIWLLSPYTKGSSVLYRKFVHPTLSNKEKEIDEYITQACDKSYETMMRVGKRGLNLAANAAVTAAAKGQGVLSEKLRSFSMQDLTLIRDEDTVHMQSRDPQLHASGASLLETIEDSASCYSSGEESSVAHRSNGTPSDTRTDPSDEDAGDKLPKRTQSLKTPKKAVSTC
ncbi:receptor expression-enhancing protein 2 isoform X4 [Serinus canaria]|uniref:receptor expression-enhancing protein 2 isoform X4 n=1 Tax=Serinus canaria TaxID=9135 RepID=UPI0008DB58EC|nr:receptor expression-enhancing protein 2 isoform X4 [Serinus canaria]